MKSPQVPLAVLFFLSSACMAATITLDGQTTGTAISTRRAGPISQITQNGTSTATYEDGSVVDRTFYGNLAKRNLKVSFDLINKDSTLYTGKFSEYFNLFLNNYKINEMGRFTPAANARTPANQCTRDEFMHFVKEASPTLVIETIDQCVTCSGSGHHVGVDKNQKVTEVNCEPCKTLGYFATKLTVALTNTSRSLPTRPTIADFVSVGMLAAPESTTKPMKPVVSMNLDRVIHAANSKMENSEELPKKIPVEEVPKPAPLPPKKPEPEIVLTQLQIFQMTKSKAEAGNSQAQYELALFYLQEPEKPVPLDYFEAFNWMLKASVKNHRMAQYHLGRLYENGFGVDKSLESAVQWRRSAALLGCKQSQKWMGQLYTDSFSGNPKFASIIKQDPSNLVEAYAWFNLGSEVPFPPRLDPKIPGPEELEFGGPPLTVRDYNSEKSIPTSAARDRDIIARNPIFNNKKTYEDAKARCVSLAKEAQEHRAQNRPK